MIDSFETGVRIDSSSQLFTFIDRESNEYTYSYWEARLISAALARRLHFLGVNPGDVVLIDLPNCPEFVFFALACAYGDFTMLLMDHMIPESEKLKRRLEAERAGYFAAIQVDFELARNILSGVRNLPNDSSEIIKQICGRTRKGKSIMGESQDFIDDIVHFAERAAHLFDREKIALIVVAEVSKDTETKRAKSRAVPLSWANLLDSSMAMNDYFSTGASRLWQERLPFNSFSDSGTIQNTPSQSIPTWQCSLPLCSIGGFQTLVRAIMLRTPLSLYTGFEPEQLLCDVELGHATHVVVDDMTLQDLMTVEEWRNDAIPGLSSRLALYQGILLTGRMTSTRTIRRAYDLGARLFVGYGMPQTSGDVAISSIAADYNGGLAPLAGYEVCVIDPDEDGCGRLAIKGPGVFEGYLNTQTAFTVDHFFITEDKVVIENDHIYVQNRAQNMFVSAGQNIYPVEIADILRHVEGVSSVHVFGVPDSRCGMLPIAVLERNNTFLTPQDIEEKTRAWFSGFPVPISVFVFDELPRNEQGKLNRVAIEAFFSA